MTPPPPDFAPPAPTSELAAAVTAYLLAPGDAAARTRLVAALGGSQTWRNKVAHTLALVAAGLDRMGEDFVADVPGCPDDLRAAGWGVVHHYDHPVAGKMHTHWVFGNAVNKIVRGSGANDVVALERARHAAKLPSLVPGADRP